MPRDDANRSRDVCLSEGATGLVSDNTLMAVVLQMKVLLTGAGGQLGYALQRAHPSHWALTALGAGQLDISDAQAVCQCIETLRPAVVINAAAYNAVDHAEQARTRAFAVNAWGPRHLARAADRVGARLVHISTDYVFDGQADHPYDERSTPNPLNVYGESKYQGEQWVFQAQAHALVLRTSWVYGAHGRNFVIGMLRAARAGQAVRVVDDQVGAPTFVNDLAAAIVGLIERSAPGGLYHCSGATALTRYAFARAIFEAADRIDSRDRLALLAPISSSEYPSAARRPKYGVLDCSKLAAMGLAPGPVDASLSQVVQDWLMREPA